MSFVLKTCFLSVLISLTVATTLVADSFESRFDRASAQINQGGSILSLSSYNLQIMQQWERLKSTLYEAGKADYFDRNPKFAEKVLAYVQERTAKDLRFPHEALGIARAVRYLPASEGKNQLVRSQTQELLNEWDKEDSAIRSQILVNYLLSLDPIPKEGVTHYDLELLHQGIQKIDSYFAAGIVRHLKDTMISHDFSQDQREKLWKVLSHRWVKDVKHGRRRDEDAARLNSEIIEAASVFLAKYADFDSENSRELLAEARALNKLRETAGASIVGGDLVAPLKPTHCSQPRKAR